MKRRMRLHGSGNYGSHWRNREPLHIRKKIVAGGVMSSAVYRDCLVRIYRIIRVRLGSNVKGRPGIVWRGLDVDRCRFGIEHRGRFDIYRGRLDNRSRLGPSRRQLCGRSLPVVDDLFSCLGCRLVFERQQIGFAERQFELTLQIECRLIGGKFRAIGLDKLRSGRERVDLDDRFRLVFDDGGRRCDRFRLTEDRGFILFRELGYRLDPSLFGRLWRRNRLDSRLLRSAGAS